MFASRSHETDVKLYQRRTFGFATSEDRIQNFIKEGIVGSGRLETGFYSGLEGSDQGNVGLDKSTFSWPTMIGGSAPENRG